MSQYPSIWLRRDGDDAVVSINVKGREIEIIREPLDSPFSHCIHDGGIKRAIDDPNCEIFANTKGPSP